MLYEQEVLTKRMNSKQDDDIAITSLVRKFGSRNSGSATLVFYAFVAQKFLKLVVSL